MAMENDFQYLFKVVLIGDSGVGKSNLMTRYTADEFNVESPSTIGVEFMTKSMKVENRDVKVQIWDTAGQERFRAISRSIYHGAKGAMLVYDITNQASFDNVSTWLQELRSHVQPSAVVMLIGNKCDLEHLRTVQKEQASKFAAENQLVLLETSALDSTNVDKAFEWLVKEVYNVVNSTGGVANTGKAQMATGKTVSINQPSRQAEKPKRSCCK
ncbi:GTP-binding protein ypt3 [Diplonema papillatum]|nr:GTP-binding protein ypt3 [Diplonema papillatum]